MSVLVAFQTLFVGIMDGSSELSVSTVILKRFFQSTVRSYLWVLLLVVQFLMLSNLLNRFHLSMWKLLWKSVLYSVLLSLLNVTTFVWG